MNGPKKVKRPNVVIVAPSREIQIRKNVEFGKEIARLSESSKERIAFVASADQGHAHVKSGPYGFHPAAKAYDELVVRAITEGNLRPLLRLDPQFIEDAKPDSLWQLAVLEGILSEVKMKPEFISYNVPTYFGMICASFVRSTV